MVTVVRWTGREVRVLREVLRLSVRAFAGHTQLSASRIAEMEAEGERAQLRRATQQILDRALAAASEEARTRFCVILGPGTVATGTAPLPTIVAEATGRGGSETDRRKALATALGLTGAAITGAAVTGVPRPGVPDGSVSSLLGRLPLDYEDLEAGPGRQGVGAYAELSKRLWQLYWNAPARPLFDAAYAQLRLGADLAPGVSNEDRPRLMSALSLSALLTARLAFFDLNRPGTASHCHQVALAAASEGEDHLMAAVVLGHMAFEPVFAGDQQQASALTQMALASAERGGSLVRSWLHCVASEASARAGDGAGSLRQVELAEAAFVAEEPVPDWLDFYDLTRLHCFAGYAAMAAGERQLATDRLSLAVDTLGDEGGAKQRSVVCADLAVACQGDGDRAAHYLHRAVDALEMSWYGTGFDRARQARAMLGDSGLGRQVDQRLAVLPGGGRR